MTSGLKRTVRHSRYVNIPEVLHGALHPEVHVNQFKKKKKHIATPNATQTQQ